MRIKKILKEFLFWLVPIALFLFFPTYVLWACESQQAALNNCRDTEQECYICQTQWWLNCNWLNCDFGWCDLYENAYNNCIASQNSQWWNNNPEWESWQPWTTPPAGTQCELPSIPAIGWVCNPWYKTGNNNCCVLICPWENSYRTGWEPVETNCKSCENWTIANETHTKCICNSNEKCCWIKLNTVVPFIWDCIELNTDSHRWDTTAVTSITAFPLLMQWLMKILMSAIMVFSFLMVIIAWLMMTTWAFSNSSFSKWKNILKNVIISLILLWCSWLILSLINPSFFGG